MISAASRKIGSATSAAIRHFSLIPATRAVVLLRLHIPHSPDISACWLSKVSQTLKDDFHCIPQAVFQA
ncbi:hypothetical protein CgunFtcFv8_013658 [Champsocephalus gunnari]|uniref:Uncharacterized protein n=1 Tax=Champsocephalus gunnari TaxID=52237 RepID=A0AAN8DT01_CHAGU|nr:hypothetical protein CgunFtcFv8_013658 [Champsocephalus gunnari]